MTTTTTTRRMPTRSANNAISRPRVSQIHRKSPHIFELVFFEDGREKMVLAEGSAACMQWTKNEMRNAPPYNHGLLMLRHKESI